MNFLVSVSVHLHRLKEGLFCSQLDEQLFIVLEHCIISRFAVQSCPVTILPQRSNVGVLFFFFFTYFHFPFPFIILFRVDGLCLKLLVGSVFVFISEW